MHLTNPASRFQRSISVIASHPVGAKRRRMTGSAKQSIEPTKERMDCFVARAPRNDVVRSGHKFAFSRHDLPEVCLNVLPRKQRGSEECRVRAAPAVSCANARVETHTSIQVQRKHSGIPRAMALRLMA